MLQSSVELRVGVFDIVIIEKRGLGLIGSNHIDVDTRRKGLNGNDQTHRIFKHLYPQLYPFVDHFPQRKSWLPQFISIYWRVRVG